MTIGFYHVATDTPQSQQGYECARILVKSAKKHMPDVPVVMFTDETSPAVKGVDKVRRKPAEPMALLRMRHHASVSGDWLFVDTDVLFQNPVLDVFQKATWDIGVTSRDWAHLPESAGFAERMPYNMGVVFSRCPHFWAECYTRLRNMDEDLTEWMGDQHAFCDAIESERYSVKTLSGVKYNFPPELPGRSVKDMERNAFILHFKGDKRKSLMFGEARCA